MENTLFLKPSANPTRKYFVLLVYADEEMDGWSTWITTKQQLSSGRESKSSHMPWIPYPPHPNPTIATCFFKVFFCITVFLNQEFGNWQWRFLISLIHEDNENESERFYWRKRFCKLSWGVGLGFIGAHKQTDESLSTLCLYKTLTVRWFLYAFIAKGLLSKSGLALIFRSDTYGYI